MVSLWVRAMPMSVQRGDRYAFSGLCSDVINIVEERRSRQRAPLRFVDTSSHYIAVVHRYIERLFGR